MKFTEDMAFIESMWYRVQRQRCNNLDRSLTVRDGVTTEHHQILNNLYSQQMKSGWNHFTMDKVLEFWGEVFTSVLQESKDKEGKTMVF